MKVSIALSVLSLIALSAAAPAADGQKDELRSKKRGCKARQNNKAAKPITSSAKAAVTTTSSTVKPSTTSTSTTASTASSAAPSSGGSAPNNAIGGMLKLHDDFRAHYGAGAMTWSTELADYAQKVANTCVFEHSHGPYGENLAVGVGGGYNVERAFKSWADEAKDYDWNNPGFNSKTGHFTQVVWKATEELGCASAMCDDGTIFTGYGQKSLYVVCEYRKPGNVVGNNNQYFKDNVGTYRD